MEVREIMTENPVCCTPETSMQEAAKLMADHDCGEIPVLDNDKQLVGVVTDRDMTCRGIAQGKGPDSAIREVMTDRAITVTPETDIEECCELMEDNQIRRVPVVDENGVCCGIVSQADIARQAPEHETAEMLKEISQPMHVSSRGMA